MTLSEQVFRQFHVETAFYTGENLNSCSEAWLSEQLFIESLLWTALNYIYINEKFYIRRGDSSYSSVYNDDKDWLNNNKILKGQAEVEIIIANPLVFYSSP